MDVWAYNDRKQVGGEPQCARVECEFIVTDHTELVVEVYAPGIQASRLGSAIDRLVREFWNEWEDRTGEKAGQGVRIAVLEFKMDPVRDHTLDRCATAVAKEARARCLAT